MSRRWLRQVPAAFAVAPAVLVVLFVYLGGSLWAGWVSMTTSRILPNSNFIGLRQYESLLNNTRWEVSIGNLVLFGVLFVAISITLGFLLAILIDQKIKGESFFRALLLYPFSMSFIVTGLIWYWVLNPTMGLQKLGRDFGFTTFTFDWIVNQDKVIYTLVAAAVWHAAGLVMAIALAGLRGIDEEIWKASRIDGIPTWRAYISIVLPMLGGSLATAFVLLSISVVRLYDLVVSMTNGGPGLASEVPAKFIIDHLFDRQNIGSATAASTMILIGVLAFIAPFVYLRNCQAGSGAAQ